jgi:hypothetical protein
MTNARSKNIIPIVTSKKLAYRPHIMKVSDADLVLKFID